MYIKALTYSQGQGIKKVNGQQVFFGNLTPLYKKMITFTKNF